MNTELFNSVYSSTQVTINPLMFTLSLATSIFLGLILALVYRYQTLYTKEFVITLTILPSILGIIILLVNGSLGTSLAVAGTFSLVRFRSAAGGSRELLALFLSMAIGLCTGMGYLFLAILSTLLFLGIWLALEKMTFFSSGQTVRYLTVDLLKEQNDEKDIRVILQEFCQTVELVSVKSSHKGTGMKIHYQVNLKSDDYDVSLINKLLTTIEDVDVSMTKVVKKKKSL